MRRRELIAGLAVGGLPLLAQAQPHTKAARIGYLMSAAPEAPIAQRGREAFRQGLRELGYVEGQNVTIEYRFAEGRLDRLAGLAAELTASQVDVIVAAPSPSAVAAKRATGTIPIVMISVGDPEGLGLVASLARPAGNVTGLSFGVGMQTFGKALELLAEAVPGVRRIAILSNPFNPTQSLVRNELDVTAHSVGVLLPRFDVGRVEDLEGAFAAMTDAQVGAVMVITDALFINNAVRVAAADLWRVLREIADHQRERAKVDRLLAEKLFSGITFRAHWRSLIGRTVSVAHCTMHDVQPDGRALCAVLDGAAQVADIRLRLASTSPPPVDCSGPKLSVACSVVATGTVLNVGGEAGLAEASISR